MRTFARSAPTAKQRLFPLRFFLRFYQAGYSQPTNRAEFGWPRRAARPRMKWLTADATDLGLFKTNEFDVVRPPPATCAAPSCLPKPTPPSASTSVFPALLQLGLCLLHVCSPPALPLRRPTLLLRLLPAPFHRANPFPACWPPSGRFSTRRFSTRCAATRTL